MTLAQAIIMAITGRGKVSPPIDPPDSNAPKLIIFGLESNSGSFAQNSDAFSSELLARAGIQILNNTTFLFEDLHIGVNNVIDHDGIPNGTTHSWELQLSNRVIAGDLTAPIYLVKAGQGGSKIADWGTSGTYYIKLMQRVNAAVTLIEQATGQAPDITMFYTQGINDMAPRHSGSYLESRN